MICIFVLQILHVEDEIYIFTIQHLEVAGVIHSVRVLKATWRCNFSSGGGAVQSTRK